MCTDRVVGLAEPVGCLLTTNDKQRIGLPMTSSEPTSQHQNSHAQMRARVLASATELLVEDGFDRLRMDTVAARSGVPIDALHQQWHTVDRLIADVFAAANENWLPADTGSLLDDLTAMNKEIDAALNTPQSAVSALIAASFRSAEVREAMHQFVAERYRRCSSIVTRAIERGELAAGTDPVRLLVAATAPVYHQLLLPRGTTSDELTAQAAHDAVAPFRP